MLQRKHALTVALFFSASVLYCLTRIPYECTTASPAPSTTVSISKSIHPARTSIPFQIVVLTRDRKESLQRLLDSLRNAQYDGDRADLRIWVDRASLGWNAISAVKNVLRRNVGVDREVVLAASNFEWPHGEKTVNVWDRHVGIWGQWLDTWRPSGNDDNESSVILEDDLEVSPMYYRWLQGAKAAYGKRADIFGYTLQRGTLRANQTGFGRRGLRVKGSEKCYLYLLLGSWGYAPEAKRWAEFREWYHEKSCEFGYHPYVEGLIPTKWYKKQERKRSMWTMWHIKFADMRNLYTVYANLEGSRTLASNWREPGLHFKLRTTSKKASPDFELLRASDSDEGSGKFDFPSEPRVLGWNGTYIDRNGVRTKL